VLAKPLRVAIVGVGRWGINHLRLLGERHDRRAGVELVAAVDTTASARERAAVLRPGLRVGDDVSEVLGENVDALIVATPPETHAELARRALEAGKHVLVEKPLCMCPVAARELAALAERRGLALATGHLVLHQAAYERLFDELRPQRATAVSTLREGAARGAIDPVEVLWSLGPHDVGVALRTLGPGLRVAVARGLERGVLLELAGGLGERAAIRLERGASPARRGATVETAAGRYELDEVAGTLSFVAAGVASARRALAVEPSSPPLDRQLGAFLRQVRRGHTPEAVRDPGPEVVALLHEAARRLAADLEGRAAEVETTERAMNALAAAGTEGTLSMAAASLPG